MCAAFVVIRHTCAGTGTQSGLGGKSHLKKKKIENVILRVIKFVHSLDVIASLIFASLHK